MEVVVIKTFGRQTIYANYTEKELLTGSPEEVEAKVLDILANSIDIHNSNNVESIYLKDYLYGMQDIYTDKEKHTRKEIDNKSVENWAYAFADFKKTYLLGKPIQYVQLNDKGAEEIAELNKYCRYENKKSLDMLLYEDILACGRAFRYTNFDNVNKIRDEEDDEISPFELINCPVEDTEVVYSSKLGNEQLLSYIKTSMKYITREVNPQTGETEEKEVPYEEYTVYTRTIAYTVSSKTGNLVIIDKKPILLKNHTITEYYMNPKRISMIEIGKDLFNDINYLESLDKDDMEQFVNALMIFTNAEIDEEGLEQAKDLGAVNITSTEGKKASVDLLQGRLSATDTQTYYTRLLTSLHQILGIPMAGDSGTVTSGDTGKAKLTGQGFTSAGIRAEGDETMFGMADRECLKKILKICRMSPKSSIKNLKASDIDAKFQRDMSDNLLVKTQGLLNLYACDIPREIANSIIGLFGDSNAVTRQQEELFGPQVSQQGSTLNAVDTQMIDTQNNDINDTMEIDYQS